MTYIKCRHGLGQSTKMTCLTLNYIICDFLTLNNIIPSRAINKALELYIHDLQTDYNVKGDKFWLLHPPAHNIAHQADNRGKCRKNVRVRADLLDYLNLNMYSISTAVNIALVRWQKMYKQNKLSENEVTWVSRSLTAKE